MALTMPITLPFTTLLRVPQVLVCAGGASLPTRYAIAQARARMGLRVQTIIDCLTTLAHPLPRAELWTPTGGWWPDPKGWRFNTFAAIV